MTTMYLRNTKEIAAAARAAKILGYNTTQNDIRSNDRYVMNIVSRLGGDQQLSRAIVEAVSQVR